MENQTGFNPIADTLNALSQIEFTYFIPVIFIFAIMFVTGTFKKTYPKRYAWKKGKGFVPMDAGTIHKRLTPEQQEEVKRKLKDINSE